MSQFARTEMLLGKEALSKLKSSKVAVFGIGGVGGFVAEALVRAGVGKLDLIDADTVSLTNLNRQIIALHSTLDMPKVEVAKKRFCDINPDVEINAVKCFYSEQTENEFDFFSYDYIVDAIDSINSKVVLAVNAKKCGVAIISAMGAGNRLNPEMLKVADISKTSVCPLARVMRKKLREAGINHLKVVFSTEEAIKPSNTEENGSLIGSVSFVPSVMGLMMAGEVIKDLCKATKQEVAD